VTISQNVVNVNGTSTMVVPPSIDTQHVILTNLQPAEFADNLMRYGHIYEIGQKFTLSNGGSAAFQITTGDTGAQFQYYEIDADESSVFATLLEGATFGSATAVVAHNANRNFADNYTSELTGATAVSGGTVISTEYVSAANQGGGSILNTNIYTLRPNTSYVMKFVDDGGTGTEVHFKLGFAEQYNGYNDIWLGAVDGSMRLRGGDSVSFDLYAGESINASTSGLDCKLAIVRQD
jgi:hypothetical protein